MAFHRLRHVHDTRPTAGLSTGWGLPWTPPHPQSAEQKGAEEHDNANEQQEQQAFGDGAYDA
jgi:hypothetical protein